MLVTFLICIETPLKLDNILIEMAGQNNIGPTATIVVIYLNNYINKYRKSVIWVIYTLRIISH